MEQLRALVRESLTVHCMTSLLIGLSTNQRHTLDEMKC